MMRDHGVHRVTIGIQSFNETVLRLMNRHHGREEALRSIELSLQAGFEVNIEFIFGYPGQDLENWAEGIEEACKLGVTEIQLYRLKVDAYGDYQGPIKQYLNKYPDRVVTNETAIMMKQVAHDILNRHGYHENVLRRVFSKGPQYYSHYAHNQCCRLLDQIGIGLTAFSSLRNRFVLNTDDFNEYYARIEAGKLPCNRGLVRSMEDQIRWAMILPLKNRTVRHLEFEARTGLKLEQVWPEKIQSAQGGGADRGYALGHLADLDRQVLRRRGRAAILQSGAFPVPGGRVLRRAAASAARHGGVRGQPGARGGITWARSARVPGGRPVGPHRSCSPARRPSRSRCRSSRCPGGPPTARADAAAVGGDAGAGDRRCARRRICRAPTRCRCSPTPSRCSATSG